jgi:hypothetical protein
VVFDGFWIRHDTRKLMRFRQDYIPGRRAADSVAVPTARVRGWTLAEAEEGERTLVISSELIESAA